jgi:HEAT repeat protein
MGLPPELARIRKARAAATKALDELEAVISHRNYDVRLNALEALAACTLDLEPHVRRGLRDRHELVRITALELAGEFALFGLEIEIVKHLKSDRSELARSAAAAALGEMGSVAWRKVLEDRIRLAGEHEKSRIYFALVKLGVRKYFNPFLKGLTHIDYRIRCATANLALLMDEPTVRTRMVKSLKDAIKRETTVAARSTFELALKEISGKDRKQNKNKSNQQASPG